VPFNWAQTRWNQADLALARHALTPGTALLDAAQAHLDAAREVFSEGPSEHQLERCDELQDRIDALRGAP